MRNPTTRLIAVLLAAGVLHAPSVLAAVATRHVFVIAMENQDRDTIYEQATRAPYLAALMRQAARSENFTDELPLEIPSAPHYLWMEAGTNSFDKTNSNSPEAITFDTDEPPSSTHSVDTSDHLVAQMAARGVSWRAYQESMPASPNGCPVSSSLISPYVARHNPFVYFKDVAWAAQPNKSLDCATHMRPYEQLADDLKRGDVPNYVFITPDLCHDMHGFVFCGPQDPVAAGDAWLGENLPPLIAWANAHGGVIFLTWDEGDKGKDMPFIAVGKGVKKGWRSGVQINHRALVRTIEEIFGLPALASVRQSVDLGDLFVGDHVR